LGIKDPPQTRTKTASQNFRLFHERDKAHQQFIRFGEETKFLMGGARGHAQVGAM
jgi:hypothetical protein